MRPGHFRWPTNSNIPLFLTLVGEDGRGVSGKTPYVTVRRFKETYGGFLDNYFWDGAAFIATPVYLTMTEVDTINSPGLYSYLFMQSLIGLEYQYLVEYHHDFFPIGIDEETHLVTNEVYIPNVNPDPIVIGTQSIMGQLELIKDGGSGLFSASEDNLHVLRFGLSRILGLLHENAMLDKQQYDGNGQLLYARLRVFDSPNRVPITPGGEETLGLTQKYEIRAEYSGPNVVKNFNLKRVL